MIFTLAVIFVSVYSGTNQMRYYHDSGCPIQAPEAFVNVDLVSVMSGDDYPDGELTMNEGCLYYNDYDVSAQTECNSTGIYLYFYDGVGCTGNPTSMDQFYGLADGGCQDHVTASYSYSVRFMCVVPSGDITTDYAHLIVYNDGSTGCSDDMRQIGNDLYVKDEECITMIFGSSPNIRYFSIKADIQPDKIVYYEYINPNCTNLDFSLVMSDQGCYNPERRSGGNAVNFKGMGAFDVALGGTVEGGSCVLQVFACLVFLIQFVVFF